MGTLLNVSDEPVEANMYIMTIECEDCAGRPDGAASAFAAQFGEGRYRPLRETRHEESHAEL